MQVMGDQKSSRGEGRHSGLGPGRFFIIVLASTQIIFVILGKLFSFFGLLFSHLKGYSGKGRLMNLIKGSFKFKF